MNFTNIHLPKFFTVPLLKSDRHQALGVLLAVMTSVFSYAPPAPAADTVIFKYKGEQVTLGVGELRNFVRTGDLPSDLQRFLQSTAQVPSKVREILNLSIRVNPQFFRNLVNTSTGEFVLLKLDEAIASSASRNDLQAVRSTLVQAVEEDGQLNLIRLLEKYPIQTITVDLTNLEPIYLQAQALVERIIPALEVAKRFLQDLVCECPQGSNLPGTEGLIATALTDSDCKPNYTAVLTEEGIVIKDLTDQAIVLESVKFTFSRLNPTVE